MELQMMKIWTFFEKEEQVEYMESPRKGETGQRYGLSLERRNKSNIWTIVGKEEQVEYIKPPHKKGE